MINTASLMPPRWALSDQTISRRSFSLPTVPGLRDLWQTAARSNSPSSLIDTTSSDSHNSDPWLLSTQQRLDKLARLEPGWDGESARAISSYLIDAVRGFISSPLVTNVPTKPSIVPTFEGGLLIEWHSETVDLIIETAPAGEVSYYYCDNETGDEVEEPLGSSADALAAAFMKLGLRP